jgi:hypothetical protein
MDALEQFEKMAADHRSAGDGLRNAVATHGSGINPESLRRYHYSIAERAKQIVEEIKEEIKSKQQAP